MTPEDRRELLLLREEQERLREIAGQLDRRIERLRRRIEAPAAEIAGSPRPAVSSHAEPPPLPSRAAVTETSPAVPSFAPLHKKPDPQPEEMGTTKGAKETKTDPPLSSGSSISWSPPSAETSPVHPEVPDDPARPSQPSEAAVATEPLELRVGTFWMARIGIVILLTGLVFLGNYAYQRIVPLLGPAGKLSLLALAAGALAGVGAYLERSREATRNYGRVLLAGGAALLYYTAYAAHFVAPLRVIESPWLGGMLLLALGGGFLWWADRRRSEPTALLAVLLSYYTSAINPIGTFTLFSNLLLTAAAVFFLVRHQWTRISFASLAATYGSYAFWRFHQIVEAGSPASQFGVGLAFVAGYWVLFTAAVFLVRGETLRGSQRVAFLTANNGAFFAFAAMHFGAHRPDQFWMFALGYGVILLALSALAARRHADDRAMDGAYLAQGLALATLGLAAKLTGPQFAVVLAVESAALLASSRRRHGILYEIAAGLCALGAMGLTVQELEAGKVSPVGLGVPVAGLLLFDAWWIKHLRSEFSLERLSERALSFAILGLIVLGTVLWHAVPESWQLAAFTLVAVLSIGVLWIARLPEIVFPAQTFLAVGVGLFVTRAVDDKPLPGWSALPVIVGALVLTHWWQRPRRLTLEAEPGAALQLACAAGAVLTGIFWLREVFIGDAWLVASSVAALATLAYGLVTRAWAVALAGQAFTILAAGFLATGLALGHPFWAAALAPIANLVLTSLLAEFVATRRLPQAVGTVTIAQLAMGYRTAAAVLLGAWAFEYVTPVWRVAFFSGLGAVQLLWASARRSPERAILGGGYAVAGIALFWSRLGTAPALSELLAILAVPASLRLGRRLSGGTVIPLEVRNGLVIAAAATTWLWVTRWTQGHGYGGHLTAAWALLALLMFAAGLGLRERAYRIGGFGILALAVGRLFFIDVWRFDTLYRIASFLVLGAVLMLLSFVYNRFAEAIRRWL